METRRQKMFILNASKTQRAGGMSCRIGSVLLLFYSATNKPRPWHRFDFLPVNGRRRRSPLLRDERQLPLRADERLTLDAAKPSSTSLIQKDERTCGGVSFPPPQIILKVGSLELTTESPFH